MIHQIETFATAHGEIFYESTVGEISLESALKLQDAQLNDAYNRLGRNQITLDSRITCHG